MKGRRNLAKDLGITAGTGTEPVRPDLEKIKCAVHEQMDSSGAERKIHTMKARKKICMIAAAAALTLGVTAFASGGIVKMWTGSSSSRPEYTSFPSEQQCVKDIGYLPVLVEEFSNGYTFKSGSVVSNNLKDEAGASVEKFKSVTFRYERDGAPGVNISQGQYQTQMESENGQVFTVENGTEIYYSIYTNKLVPEDYEMTAEDKRAEESGELVFSWGAEEIQVQEVESVFFEKDGMHTCIQQIDGALTADELVQMAKEMLRK